MSLLKIGEIADQRRKQFKQDRTRSIHYEKNIKVYQDIIDNILE